MTGIIDADPVNRAVASASIDGAELAETFSAWGMFMQADFVVKFVMILLAFASVWCWAIIFEKMKSIKTVNSRAKRFEDSFWSGEPLDKFYERIKQAKPDPLSSTFMAGMDEWRMAATDHKAGNRVIQAGLQQRIERAMAVEITRSMDKLEKNMTFLANVGSTAPFVGLFGTVWGVMNAFMAIAGTNNTSLAVVAPGIAEALFTTALGLVAAIPAMIAYNKFTSDLNRYAERLETFASEFSSILDRHLARSSATTTSEKMNREAA